MQWNAEGAYPKKTPLKNKLDTAKIDIACLQETHLKVGSRFTIRGYQTFSMPREGRTKGGVLILVRNEIPATEFKLDTNQQTEIHGIKFTVDNTDITLFNVYSPQDKQLCLNLMDIPPENCLVIGDFNSHSTSWGYQENDTRGNEVEDWQIDNSLVLINDPKDPPTFFSRRWRTTTTPDLAFATGDIASKTSRHVQNQLGGSDHRPIILAIDVNYRIKDIKTFPRWNYKKAYWPTFTRLCEENCKKLKTRESNIYKPVKAFEKTLLDSATKTIPRGARKNYRPYWTEELEQLEEEVSKNRENVEKNPTVENNIAYKASEAKCKKTYIQEARRSWNEKTEKLNFDKDGTKLWNLTKALNNEQSYPTTISLEKDGKTITGKEVANCFIDNYEDTCSVYIPSERKKEVQAELNHQKTNSDAQTTPECMNKDFSLQELNDALESLKNNKSPGPDKITNEMLQHLGPIAKAKLLEIYNNSWKKGQVPQIWKEANMMPVHKPGKKRNEASSYRPISLTSCIGKTMERMINTRLSWYLESNNIITPEQAGFRQHHSTEDQVTYIAQKIEDGFQDKRHTLTVWLDMEKAFDKVWKDGLRLKLRQCGVSGHMYQWISQFLTNRRARVHVNGAYSRKKVLKEGVPQGGVLSPTLFLVFINDILKDMPSNIRGAIYADDLVIWCTEEHLPTAQFRLQLALDRLNDWTKKWFVKINAAKTTFTIFTLSPKIRGSIVKLKIDDHFLKQDNNPTYLGITFDQTLTWRQQIEKAETRAKSRLGLMKKLSGASWGADHNTQKKVYTGYVRPVLEYGISVWGTASKTHLIR